MGALQASPSTASRFFADTCRAHGATVEYGLGLPAQLPVVDRRLSGEAGPATTWDHGGQVL